MERRLAAILALDVVGYSRLIGADEAGTLTALRALRKDLVEPTLNPVTPHNGSWWLGGLLIPLIADDREIVKINPRQHRLR